MQLPSLRTLNAALPWVLVFGAFAAWLGWLQSPGVEASRVRDEWVKAHAAASALIEDQGGSIRVLQDRDGRTQRDLDAIRGKLDEMAMVLYSLERRSR